MEYKKVKCTCGKDARIVENRVGVYIRCPYCNRCTYMQNTVDDALKLWQEMTEDNTGGNMESNIKFIKIDNLLPHPDNPRKDVGDVSELAESIKKNGIMQNLTVMPYGCLTEPVEEQSDADNISVLSDFHVLIGHRRLAAAKLAGLTEMPCKIISKISKREQVSIMLEENMQRHDLTIYEQAQGFQMMLDLGETEETIAEKTGFSVTTVKRRINIAKLDQDLLKKKEDSDSFQLSLSDLYALEQVEDVKTRNKILRESGNSNELKWRSERAAKDARLEKSKKAYAKLLKDLGIEENDKARYEIYGDKWQEIRKFDLDKEPPKSITVKETEGVMWTLNGYSGDKILLIKKAPKKEKKLSKEELARKEREQNRKLINGKIRAMNKRCREFILSIIEGRIRIVKNNTNLYKDAIWESLVELGLFMNSTNFITFIAGKIYSNCSGAEKEAANEKISKLSILEEMLIILHHAIDTAGELVDYTGAHNKSRADKLLKAYEILEDMGWTFEDDELDILNGTSELYVKGDKLS